MSKARDIASPLSAKLTIATNAEATCPLNKWQFLI